MQVKIHKFHLQVGFFFKIFFVFSNNNENSISVLKVVKSKESEYFPRRFWNCSCQSSDGSPLHSHFRYFIPDFIKKQRVKRNYNPKS